MTTRTLALELLYLLRAHLRSFYLGYRYRSLFANIEIYCMFIGYPRSGHSLIGALLDAHPEIIIAHELGVFKHLLAGFHERQIDYLLLEKSRAFKVRGAVSSPYSYSVPNQWQGRFENLRVIGDKQGGGAALRLQARPWLFYRLQNRMSKKIKVFHVVRNPFDNISTISKRHGLSVSESIRFYFSLCETVSELKKRLRPSDLFEIRHESFIENPKDALREMCRFLGVVASEGYLKDCASVVFPAPRKTREQVPWEKEQIESITERMARYPFLEGYAYDK